MKASKQSQGVKIFDVKKVCGFGGIIKILPHSHDPTSLSSLTKQTSSFFLLPGCWIEKGKEIRTG